MDTVKKSYVFIRIGISNRNNKSKKLYKLIIYYGTDSFPVRNSIHIMNYNTLHYNETIN